MSTTLDQHRSDFGHRRFLAMPLAGTIIWALIAVAGLTLSPNLQVWSIFIGTGMIIYLGMFISRFTGENFLDKSRPKNPFDGLFMFTVAQALAVFAIAIPFFLADYTSLPLTVGILTGLMWIPLSWIISHWVGLFHGITRTLLIVAAWYAFPEQRFVVIPLIIVAIYVVTMVVLESRWRRIRGGEAGA